jgi:hypothetical protein
MTEGLAGAVPRAEVAERCEKAGGLRHAGCYNLGRRRSKKFNREFGLGYVLAGKPEPAACFFFWRSSARERNLSYIDSTS